MVGRWESPVANRNERVGQQNWFVGSVRTLTYTGVRRGDATLSYCHMEDAARAFTAAVEGDATGTFHVVDDEPSPFATFVRTFADELGAADPRRLPGWLLRPVVGKYAVGMLTTDMATTNGKFRDAFDWEPTYASHGDGLAQIVSKWREDGTIEQVDDAWQWSDG